MKLYLTPDSIDWANIMPRLQNYQPEYDALATHQKQHFNCLLALFHTFVGTHIGEDEFFGERQFVWNAKKWLGIMLKLSLSKDRADSRDCLISLLPRSKGRPILVA